MRAFPAVLLLIATLAAPVAAATETWGCHSYEAYVGDRSQGAGASTDDHALAVAAAGQYAVYDGTPLDNGYLYSVGLGTESNGIEGWQRSDHACDETNGGEIEGECFISCTF